MRVNSKMLYMIADVIESYPEKHYQDSWFEHFGGKSPHKLGDTIIYDGKVYECDTNQCIAGWAVILDGNKVSFKDENLFINNQEYTDIDLVHKASKILGLEYDSARTLFYTTDMDFDWPKILRAIADGSSVIDAVNEEESINCKY